MPSSDFIMSIRLLGTRQSYLKSKKKQQIVILNLLLIDFVVATECNLDILESSGVCLDCQPVLCIVVVFMQCCYYCFAFKRSSTHFIYVEKTKQQNLFKTNVSDGHTGRPALSRPGGP